MERKTFILCRKGNVNKICNFYHSFSKCLLVWGTLLENYRGGSYGDGATKVGRSHGLGGSVYVELRKIVGQE